MDQVLSGLFNLFCERGEASEYRDFEFSLFLLEVALIVRTSQLHPLVGVQI